MIQTNIQIKQGQTVQRIKVLERGKKPTGEKIQT